MKRKSSTLAAAQQEYLVAAPQIERLRIAIPTEPNIQEITSLIEATAADHQIPLYGLNIGKFAYDSQEPKADEPIELAVSIALKGDFETIEPFVKDLIRLPRFASVRSISMGYAESNNRFVQTTSLNLNIVLNMYYQPNYTD
jgi:Tfp pilus assembly protein PilO